VRTFERIPLFARIALLWWMALFAYPPTRPLLFYSLRWRNPDPAPPHLVAMSIIHVLVASWLVVRVLTKRRAGQDFGSVGRWTLAIGWFALTTGSCLLVAVRGAWRPVLQGDPAAAASLLWHSLVAFPFFALLAVGVTWIIWALALATVLIVRRSTRRVDTNQAGAVPGPTGG
jgi:hypothetical protein